MSTATKSARESHNGATAAEIENKIAAVKTDIASLAASIASLGTERAKGVKSDAEAKIAEVTKSGEEALDDLRDRLRDYEKQLHKSVRDRPLTSLGVAAGVGFLLAILFRR